MKTVAQWTRFETTTEARGSFDNPLYEVEASVTFRGPVGVTHRVQAFWDGFQCWRARFSPPSLGVWSVEWQSSEPALNGNRCQFLCIPYTGTNPLHLHGALRVAASGTHFEHDDGTPFFWLGDTVWNGPVKATLEDWAYFLRDRAAKRFNVIQFVTTQWVAGAGNADLRMAYVSGETLRIDPAFFHWMDRRIDMLNDYGMVACPALIWSAPSKSWALPLNPGTALPEDQIQRLAAYLVARYGSHHIVWMLAGDGDYRSELAERWKRIGRAVLAHVPQPATMHPMGRIWVGGEFNAEPWFGFHGYQSSHYGDDASMRWITEGPPATDWKHGRLRPTVNLEPCYEAHLDMTGAPRPGRVPFDAHAVRRASYWSVLASPPAGVTYGAHGVWGWELGAQPAMNHIHTGLAQPWFEAMHLPGSSQMGVLSDFFQQIAWWKLRPAPEILASQPGAEFASRFQSAATADSGRLIVVYTPEDRQVTLREDAIPKQPQAEWISPVEGSRTPANGSSGTFTTPGQGDWLLLIKS